MTRVESPLAAKSQPETKPQYAMTGMSKAPPSEAAKGPLIQPSKLTIDYNRLQIGGNKSFMEAWEEATKVSCLGSRIPGVKDTPFLGSVWGVKEAGKRLPPRNFV